MSLLLMTLQDVVMEFSYGRSDHCLEAKDFSPQYYDAILAMGPSTAIIKQMYWLYQLMQSLPRSIAGRLSSNLNTVIQMQDVWRPVSSFHFYGRKTKAFYIGYGDTDCSTPSSA